MPKNESFRSENKYIKFTIEDKSYKEQKKKRNLTVSKMAMDVRRTMRIDRKISFASDLSVAPL